MYGFIYGYFTGLGFGEVAAVTVTYLAILALIVLTSFIIHNISEAIITKVLNRDAIKNKHKWIDVLLNKRVFHHSASLIIPVAIAFFGYALPEAHATAHDVLMKSAGVITALVSAFLIGALINSVDEIYMQREVSRTKPMHGLFQIIKVATFIICCLAGVSVLAGQNPITLIGGIGAATAVITFVFKDAILGFAAGQQLVGNDLIRIGDWIEVSKHKANGNVVEISMTTVRVENFDNTFTSIPAYSLISDSFINWRGMKESGVRRIKRAIHIDLQDVRFCDKEMLDGFEKIAILKDYVVNIRAEIALYNKERGVDSSCVINGRRITNIGTFRVYIQRYIESHPGLRQDMTVIARQLASDSFGIPLEIIAFADTTDLPEYEKIQSDIFDHLYAAAKEFGLRIYQSQIAQTNGP